MADKSKRPIVIRRKRSRREHPHGVWKIAYADFMTAMMAFFLVMWLLSGFSHAEMAQISKYFRTPLAVALAGGDQNTASNSAIPGGGDDPVHSEGEVALTDVQAVSYSPRQERLQSFKQRLEAMVDEVPVLKSLGSQLKIDLVPAGLRIQIIDTNERPMFALGSARIRSLMREVLERIAPLLNILPNRITITGHTDDLRYASGEAAYSNWELSAQRANAARRALVAGGMNPDRVVRVAGAAATLRLPGELPGAAVNRRISILVLNRPTLARIMGRAQDKPAASPAPRNPVRQFERVMPAASTPAVASSASVPDTVSDLGRRSSSLQLADAFRSGE